MSVPINKLPHSCKTEKKANGTILLCKHRDLIKYTQHPIVAVKFVDVVLMNVNFN